MLYIWDKININNASDKVLTAIGLEGDTAADHKIPAAGPTDSGHKDDTPLADADLARINNVLLRPASQ